MRGEGLSGFLDSPQSLRFLGVARNDKSFERDLFAALKGRSSTKGIDIKGRCFTKELQHGGPLFHREKRPAISSQLLVKRRCARVFFALEREESGGRTAL
jgi:hypothetical protein